MSQVPPSHPLSSPVLAVAPEFEVAAALREWRHRRAREEEVPAYVVLPNRLLQEIARALPQDEEGLRQLNGMGPARMARYGGALLEVLRNVAATSARPSEGEEGTPPRLPVDDPDAEIPLAERGGAADEHAVYDHGAVAAPPVTETEATSDTNLAHETVSYRVVIEYHLEDEARRRLAHELSTGLGPISSALAVALSSGPSRVCVRVESDRTTRA